MTLAYPDPKIVHPFPEQERICFIKNTVTNPDIIIGDYTYYDDPVDSENFERNVLYHFPFIGDQLIIGKFCALAQDVRFIMNGANHNLSGISSYPFQIFGHDWAHNLMSEIKNFPNKGNTVVKNDVWIGYQSLIMPGVTIGNGAVIASQSVVVSDVPAYSIVGGNPAQVIRYRFSEAQIALLENIAWWDWPIEKITQHLQIITSADIDQLAACL